MEHNTSLSGQLVIQPKEGSFKVSLYSVYTANGMNQLNALREAPQQSQVLGLH